MTKWTPRNGEIFKARPEPENEYDKYAVAVERCGDVVGRLSKGCSARFAKTVSYFLRASNENCCRVEVTGKRINLGEGEGQQIPCVLHFSGQAKFVSKLKDLKISVWAYNFIINRITRSLNIIFVDIKYHVIILPYCIFDFTC